MSRSPVEWFPPPLAEIASELGRWSNRGDPWVAVKRVLVGLGPSERTQLIEYMAFLDGSGTPNDQAFFRSSTLSFLKVASPGPKRTDVHDHGTWAVIYVLAGEEQNEIFSVDGHSLRALEAVTLRAGSVLVLPSHLAHRVVVGTSGVSALHVYGADLGSIPLESGQLVNAARQHRSRELSIRETWTTDLPGDHGP